MALLGRHVKQLLAAYFRVRRNVTSDDRQPVGRAVIFGQRELRPSCAVISETWL